MKTFYLTTMLIALISLSASSQGIYDKLNGKSKKANITFYSDKEATQVIQKLNVGESVFYAKFPLNKKDFKAPFGKLYAYSNYNYLVKNAEVKDLSNGGYAKQDERIYSETTEMDKTYGDLLKDEEMIVEFRIADDINFENSIEDVLEFGAKEYPLTVWIGDEDTPIGYGVINWDLSDGGKAYKANALASRSNYTFNASDAVNDPEFKRIVKNDIERRYDIQIYQMAQGDRVPYNRDLKYYRRNQIGITYKDLEDNKCYTGGISAFEDGAGPNGPYKYDMEGQLSQGDQIPCNRVDK